ncbi:uncharacterized protein LOC126661991 [Mercurialis annua]|uniref:uncharacterized protein LOC126661991 n=1 Tax=Mercurialis annua TaxID=3986 RepID=UPI00215E7416|nr:uncharacterized protein LOC126661991 [Mercurialis annua]
MMTWGCTSVRCKYAYMRCIAHILNLVVSDGLKESGSSYEKVRGAVRYIKNSPLRLSKFKECKESTETVCKGSLCLDVPRTMIGSYMLPPPHSLATRPTTTCFKDKTNWQRSERHRLGLRRTHLTSSQAKKKSDIRLVWRSLEKGRSNHCHKTSCEPTNHIQHWSTSKIHGELTFIVHLFHTSSSLYLSLMKTHRMPSFSSSYTKISNPPCPRSSHHATFYFSHKKINGNQTCGCKWQQREQKVTCLVVTGRGFAIKAKNGNSLEKKNDDVEFVGEKKGTIGGAVALIIGTSIGSGILALPQKASPAGIIPSSITIILCWAFLLLEALLLIEINVGLRRKKKKNKGEDENELDIISLRTMAQETLGDWGGNVATMSYVFLSYTSMIAYSSKSGELLFHFINLPESLSGFLFTALFTMLISVGGTSATDKINQWLTASMIGLLIAIEVIAVVFGGWSGLEGSSNWEKVPATIPVIIFTLVYHDLAPVLCAYLGGDLARLRASVLLGSLVPLLALLIWDAIALALSDQSHQLVDPVELLMSVRWSGISYMVEAFSLLAVGTSIIGTLLGFSEFFKEQLKNISWQKSTENILQEEDEEFGLKSWWERNKIRLTAMALVIAPTSIVSSIVPHAFSTATDIAGGYCMTMLYGVLPPAMAWAMYDKQRDDSNQRKVLRIAKPALAGIAIFACRVVIEQMFQDFSALRL